MAAPDRYWGMLEPAGLLWAHRKAPDRRRHLQPTTGMGPANKARHGAGGLGPLFLLYVHCTYSQSALHIFDRVIRGDNPIFSPPNRSPSLVGSSHAQSTRALVQACAPDCMPQPVRYMIRRYPRKHKPPSRPQAVPMPPADWH